MRDVATNKKNDFYAGFTQSYLLIFLSEVGDRVIILVNSLFQTFILVTIFSQKLNNLSVFIFASMVMVSMHTLSTLIGAAFPYVLSKTLTEVICVVLFLGFGIFMVYEGLFADGDDGKDELKEIEEKLNEDSAHQVDDEENGKKKKKKGWCGGSQWALFLFMLMCEEWGDKSQISAIALAANYGVQSIILGGALAHITCITIALTLGNCFKQILNETWLNLIGGTLFIFFGIYELILGVFYS